MVGIIDVDTVSCHSECCETVTLRGQVLLAGRHARVAEKRDATKDSSRSGCRVRLA